MIERNGGEYRPYKRISAGELIVQPEKFYGNQNLDVCAVFVAVDRSIRVYDPRTAYVGIGVEMSYIIEEVGFIQDLADFISKTDEKRLKAYVIRGVKDIRTVRQELATPLERYAQFYGAIAQDLNGEFYFGADFFIDLTKPLLREMSKRFPPKT